MISNNIPSGSDPENRKHRPFKEEGEYPPYRILPFSMEPSESGFNLARFQKKARPHGFMVEEDFYSVPQAGVGRAEDETAHVETVVDNIGGDYFISTAAHPAGHPEAEVAALSSCHDEFGIASFPPPPTPSFIKERTEQEMFGLLVQELLRTLAELGVRRLRIDISSPRMLEIVARAVGLKDFGRSYAELERDIIEGASARLILLL